MTKSAQYEAAMTRAFALAEKSPAFGENPQVGALLLDSTGRIVAEGWHRGAGTPHAEIDALSKVSNPAGLTAVVTLEPCNHTGRTGPCSLALIEAGITKVVYGSTDPGNASGGGALRLQEAGVETIGGVLADEADRLIAPWRTNAILKRPYVVLKWASSLDGRIAASDGSSKWISGSQARADVHLRRSRSQAILAGTGTILADDAELTARQPDGTMYPDQPLRVVVGKSEIPKSARVFSNASETVQVSGSEREVLAQLFERGIRQVFVEGGPTLISSFVRERLADEFLIYQAPLIIGGPKTAIAEVGIENIADAIRLEIFETKQLGEDFLLRAVIKEA
jgi:diaminohydroxyphosphoribosylaminopyrimidine deaminase/5-amino-6-(5-phosphoribosylamino)uracil reductase